MLKGQSEDFVKFWFIVPSIVVDFNCLKPNLRHISTSLDVYMGWFVLIRGIELE